jgi:predicted glycogen debranching enzyme
MVTRQVESQGETSEVPTVIAGYHWFADWGRDTMISLPGLTLPLGRARQGNEVLRIFGLFSREGLLPNNFPDSGSVPQYNTADATLWMFQAVEAIATGMGNMKTARSLYPLLADMIAWHVRGTRHGIRVDPADGLLMAGEEGVQLTWMDAKVEGWVVTPRMGKPVEINALWYNALRIMDKLRRSLGRTVVAGREEPPDFGALAEQVHASFRKRFWYDAGDYLFDVIDGPNGPDISLRPNQIFAVSLNSDLLSVDQARRVLAVVREHLLTPYGLRTLAPNDPQYTGVYSGTLRERDAAYHNGTVWTWLLGPYFDAVRAIEGSDAARKEVEGMLPAWREHLADAGLGSVSEIFDGDAPHAPRGCISQAWSVAEMLRHIWGPGKL